MTSILALIVVLGVLIFFHEFGHFLAARMFGVGVERFSLGFGPRLFGFKAGMTDYRVSVVPLGGYVKMVGEDPQEPLEEADRELSFTHKSVSRRMIIAAAGPVFNLLLAVVIFYGLFQVYGMAELQPVIGEVQADMPAEAAGLQPGDRVLAIDRTSVSTWTQMAEIIADGDGRELAVTVERPGEIEGRDEVLNLTVSPRLVDAVTIFGEPEKRYALGIVASGEVTRRTLGPVAALERGVGQTLEIIRLTGIGVGKIIAGSVSTREIGGPILIAQIAGQQAEHGLAALLGFIAFISINLAILNLLPIPVLDGGHLVFYTIEAVRGRPVTDKTREAATQIGMFFIIFLMIMAFYNDILRLFE